MPPQTWRDSQGLALDGDGEPFVATAVQNQWPMASLDVSEAFLKGLTCDEIQERRGGPKRRVSLILPRVKQGELSGVELLRTIKGYEDFNEATEVLEMLQGGFGLIDAPNYSPAGSGTS